ncbi:MAG: carboxypeptidase-like regulatory domain-containing protein [Phaeodactylibacter sp.]|nr:carboxypeptidase-like regulatory domain-containing protein [Phaeodactylibacter sp.]
MKINALLLSLLLSYLFNLSFAQETIQGIVIDSDTKEPVPFVNIGITRSMTGTVSDENGQYQLRIPSLMDVVAFSSIGYQTENIEAGKLIENGEINLRPKPYDIPTIELNATGFPEEVTLGAKLEEQGHSIGFGSSELGAEIGAHIGIDKETYIKSAHFPINHASGDSLLFRVNLYDFQNEKAGENLLPQNVIISAVQKKGMIDVDLSEFNLITANDVLLSLEWIKDDNGKGNVGITFRSKKSRRDNNLYTKYTSQAPFSKLSDLAPRAPKLELGFYLTGKQER